eukprot:NODE_16854_length_974_cov_2.463991.p6 GENE.NODE_16854_length_974_cov_2.463991~~NODE_16854_length_974_cov_2.463991.p6  ORF type:complete len:50 (-),score=22.32 NODE_16854_length_974_cov_2.463991:135-284(-)
MSACRELHRRGLQDTSMYTTAVKLMFFEKKKKKKKKKNIPGGNLAFIKK